MQYRACEITKKQYNYNAAQISGGRNDVPMSSQLYPGRMQSQPLSTRRERLGEQKKKRKKQETKKKKKKKEKKKEEEDDEEEERRRRRKKKEKVCAKQELQQIKSRRNVI